MLRARLAVIGMVVAATACSNTADPTRSGEMPPPPDATASPRVSAPPLPSTRPAHRAGSGQLGLKWSWAQPDTFPFVQDSSGGWTFYEVEWCDVEPQPGQRGWAVIDQVVRDARLLGHEPMLKLRTGQCWGTEPPATSERDLTEATQKEPSTPPVDVQAYLDFVRELVHRYAARGVHQYAIENEVDVTNFWAADLSAYDQLARQVAPVIREADPKARVIDAGTSSTGYGVVLAADELREGRPDAALRTYQRYYARRIDGGVSRWPAVTTVPELETVLDTAPAHRAEEAVELNIRLANDGVVDAFQLHYYEPTSELPGLLRHLDRRLDRAIPVQAWEVGVAWPGTAHTDLDQADEAFRLVARLLAAGVRRLVYLPAAFTPGDQTQVFRGLVDADGALLPAGEGWLALTDALAGLHGAVEPAEGDLVGAGWTIDGRTAAVLWARRGTVRLDPADVARVVDATGQEVPGEPVIGSRPVLVLGSAGGDLARSLTRGGD